MRDSNIYIKPISKAKLVFDKVNLNKMYSSKYGEKDINIDNILPYYLKENNSKEEENTNNQIINLLILSIENLDFESFKNYFDSYRIDDIINSTINKYNETLLHIAVESGLNNFINYLLEKGANPNIQQQDGETCLHYAIKYNISFKVIKLLFLYNVNPYIKTFKLSESCFDYVIKYNSNTKIVDFFNNFIKNNKNENINNENSYKVPISSNNKQLFFDIEEYSQLGYDDKSPNKNNFKHNKKLYKNLIHNRNSSIRKKDSLSIERNQDTFIIHSSKFCNLEDKLKYIQLNSLSNTNTYVSNLLTNHKRGSSIFNFYNYSNNSNYQDPTPTPISSCYSPQRIKKKISTSLNYSNKNFYDLINIPSNNNVRQRISSSVFISFNNNLMKSYNKINDLYSDSSIDLNILSKKNNPNKISNTFFSVLKKKSKTKKKFCPLSNSPINLCNIESETPIRHANQIHIFNSHVSLNNEVNQILKFLKRIDLEEYYELFIKNGLDDINSIQQELFNTIKENFMKNGKQSEKINLRYKSDNIKIYRKYKIEIVKRKIIDKESLQYNCLICNSRYKIISNIMENNIFNKDISIKYKVICICKFNELYPIEHFQLKDKDSISNNLDLLLFNIGINKSSHRNRIILLILYSLTDEEIINIDYLRNKGNIKIYDWLKMNNLTILYELLNNQGYNYIEPLFYQMISLFPITNIYFETYFGKASETKISLFINLLRQESHKFILNETLKIYNSLNINITEIDNTELNYIKSKKREEKVNCNIY